MPPTRPLPSDESQEYRVVDLAQMMPSLAQVAFPAEPLPLEQAKRSFVLWIDVSLQTMEVERLEREAEQQADGLARKPVPPRTPAEGESDFAPAMGSIEVEERAGTNHFVGVLQANRPLKQSSRSKEFVNLLDETHGSVEVLERW
jgi:hypothetical protein